MCPALLGPFRYFMTYSLATILLPYNASFKSNAIYLKEEQKTIV